MYICILACWTGLSLLTIHHTSREKLKLKKRPAKWIPHAISDQQCQWCVTMARDLQRRFTHAPTLQDHVVTSDESWFWYHEPLMKRSSSAWLRSNEQHPHKVSKDHCVRKVMLIVFWDFQGIVHCEFIANGQGVNRHVYLQTMHNLREKLHHHHPNL